MEGKKLPVMPLCESKSGYKDTGGKKRSDGKRKKTFSDEQVRSLECMFEAQTKLEPRRKKQLAGELGLQPRQVAVWFQNRRARWKSKQLEMEYGALHADFDALLSSFESLKKEKQSLAAQLQKLAELLEKPVEENSDGGNSGDGNSKGKEDRNPSWLPMEGSVDLKLVVSSDNGELIGYTGKQETSPCDSEPMISSLVLAERRCSFDTVGSFSDQSCSTSTDWWEVWPLNE